ncbi:MAG: hypothetical protein J0M07_28640 [Anaerolineae bacterium]|nr:hypothetical protein [Anaerolineae bacterium]
MTTTITEYTATDAALADLRGRFADVVFDVGTGKGMTEAKKARSELRDHRVSLEKERVRIKAPALERCRQIDSEAKRITAELEALEGPIDDQIKAEEQRKQREKEAAEQAEREARAKIAALFDTIKGMPLRAVNATAKEIEALIAEAEGIKVDHLPDDMIAAANFEKKIASNGLKAALDARHLADQEAERIKAERAELDRLRAEAAAVQAEKDRLAAEERAREAAEGRRLEQVEREKREAIERAEREARAAEQARIDAERAEARRIEDAQRAEAAKKLREEQEAAATERAKLEADKKAAAKRERESVIATATLTTAATEALALLKAEGYGEYLETQKLEAALNREPAQKEAA